MADYLLRRLGMTLLVVVLAVTINFALPRLMPGDPIESQLNQMVAMGGGATGDVGAMVEAYRRRFGLDRPVAVQYLAYWASLLRLDLGFSIANYPERVSHAILAGLPWTLGLLGAATLTSFTLGTWLGGRLGWPGTSRGLRAFGGAVLLLSSVPYFLVGMVLLYVFAIVLRWFPAGGGLPFGQTPGLDLATLRGVLWHGTLPFLSIVTAEVGAWALGMRGMITSVRGEDYVTLAQAKGLTERRIFSRYAMRNALLPQFTRLALTLGHVVSGAILVEVIFAYPGVGFRLYQAIQAKDFFVVQGIVLLLSVSIALAMVILDLLYPLIDPRIAAGGR